RLSHEDVLADPEPVDDPALQNILDSVGLTAAGRAQLVLRSFVNHFIAGEVYFIGIPRGILNRLRGEEVLAPTPSSVDPVTMDDLEWRALSMQEVQFKDQYKTIEIRLPE